MYSKTEVEYAIKEGFDAGYAQGMRYQITLNAAKAHDAKLEPKGNESQRIKKLLERIAYYEKKEG